MVDRNKYLQQLISNRNNGFPKIITGIRRCGKSFLIKEILIVELDCINDKSKRDADKCTYES